MILKAPYINFIIMLERSPQWQPRGPHLCVHRVLENPQGLWLSGT